MKTAVNVLVTIPEIEGHERFIDQIAAVSPRVDVGFLPTSDNTVVAEAMADVQVLYTKSAPDDLENANALRWVALHYSGMDSDVVRPFFEPEQEVIVTNVAGAHAVPIAEYVITVMPLLLRNFMQLFVDKQTRTYDSDHSPARELWGMTIGIVGYGHIGREVARLAVAHGMRVVALKRNPQERRELGYNWKGIGDPEGLLPDTFYGPDQLHNLLRESDFVVDCLPYTPATKDLFGATEFEAMRATAYFINIGRGGTMDIPAVALAVRCDVIAGAALDDFQTGSHRLDTDSPLWDVDNIFISPHISGTRRNVQYLERTNELFCENLRRFLAGEPMYNVVTRERGY